MDLSPLLWAGGTLFSLGIFALKTGFGLAFGRVGIRGVAVALTAYALLFTLLAPLAVGLTAPLAALLNRGPWLHLLMAAGLIAWGLWVLFTTGSASQAKRNRQGRFLRPALLLILPCPVCLSAMLFSTGTALALLPLPPLPVGGLLGLAFAALTLLFYRAARPGRGEHPEVPLGLAMIAIGLYFVASLGLPAKIEEARLAYGAFLDHGQSASGNDMAALLLTLLAAALTGYLLKGKEHTP